MRRIERTSGKLLTAAALCVLLATPAWAQVGKLAGQVTDAQGNPFPGATVLLIGATIGTATGSDGHYAVLNIPAGTYDVRYSFIGFQAKIVEGIEIQSNQTTRQDIALSSTVIQGEEVVVTAEQPIVDLSLTSSMATLSHKDIAVLPVQDLGDIVNLQAGVVNGHFRGGRIGEVQYQVDGVSVNNPYNNRSILDLDRSVLQEVQVISGAFSAQYGQAMSGVVNAVLRTGQPNRYIFTAETYMGDYFSPGNDSAQVQGLKVARYPFIGNLSPLVVQNYQASLSGPMPLAPNTTFLVNGSRLVDKGYLFGRRIFVPTDSSILLRGEYIPTGDSALVAMDVVKKWSYLGKVTNRSIPNVQVSYQAIGNVIERQDYSHGFRINPLGTTTKHTYSIVHGLDWTHTLADWMFYDLSIRQNYFYYADLKYKDADDPRYFEAGRPVGNVNFHRGAVVQGVSLGRFIQRTNSWIVTGNITGQVNQVNLVKSGFQVQTSSLDFGAPGALVQAFNPETGRQELSVRRDTLNAQVISYYPVSGAAYAQDRIEWRDLTVRAGVRLQYFDANSTVPSDLANPANSIDGAPESRPQPTTVKWSVAPRLGISFPVLDRAALFFSYGQFYQMPPLGDMFRNSDYSILKDLQAGAVSYGVLGNPDLRPQFTAQYEFGFKYNVTDYLGLDLSLFYKDIRDLLGVEFVQTYTAAQYAHLTNVDFGGVRGFTLELDQRGPGALRTSLDYTLQIATGNSSDPRETAVRAAAGEDPRPRQIPFDWDQRHTLNGSIIWFQPDNYALTAIVRLGTGRPYTPSIGTVFGSDLPTNSGRKPGFFVVDLRAEKFFNFGGVQWTAFARVFNLFDDHYVGGPVFADTGSPYYSLQERIMRNFDPSRLAAPRRIEIGVSLRGVLSTN